MKTTIAGLVGGVILFACGAVFHMAIPQLGEAGVASFPQDRELPVIESMKSVMTERKIYFFPGVDMKDSEAMKKEPYVSRLASGPTGIIAFSPGPGEPFGARYLLTEFAFNLLEGLIAAFVVAHIAASVSYGTRVLIVGLIGLSAAISIDGSYWNWYHFPTSYFVASIVMATASSLIAGAVIAKMVRPAT